MTHAPTITYWVLPLVGLYVLMTVPFLPLLLWTHALKSDGTRWLMAGMILQLLPVGLVFFPLGFVGVALLLYALAAIARRNRRYRAHGFDNLQVARHWSREYLLGLVAVGFALEQKEVSWLLLDVAAHRGFAALWLIAPLSVAMWGLIVWLFIRERRALAKLLTP